MAKAKAHEMRRSDRWDLPFSRELADPQERRDMSDQDVDRLLSLEPFCHMDPREFPASLPLRKILKNDTRIRRYQNGDVVVRQGDYGNSAFLILDGLVRVILEGLDPKLVGRRERGSRSLLRTLAQVLSRPKSPETRDARLYPQRQDKAGHPSSTGEFVFVQDVTNILKVFPIAFERTKNVTMCRGQLFGELAAIGRIPRTATVVADGEAELLEIRWQGLRELRKYDKALREGLDEQFRKHGLSVALRASPLMAQLSEADAQKVAEAAEFETFGAFDWYGTYQQLRRKEMDPLSQEPIIAQEGHYPNGMILIRAGFARLSRKRGHGEQTISYLGKGDVYGLAELSHNAHHQDHSEQLPLTATLRAVGYVDVVRIPTKTFEEFVLPNIPDRMVRGMSVPGGAGGEGQRVSLPIVETAETPSTACGAETRKIDSALMEALVENRFINGTATMVINLDRCTRCDDCIRACAAGHDNDPRFVRHGTIIGNKMIANACMHCADPVCMIGCPTGAIHRSEEGGEVVINDVTCIGCGTCAASCPYDNIRMVDVRDMSSDAIMVDPDTGRPIAKATKCDLCVDHHGGPACERACPHDALKRVNMHDLDAVATWLNA